MRYSRIRHAYPSRALAALATMLVLTVCSHSHAGASTVATQPMDAHMQVTVRATPAAGDRARADAIVAAARRVMARYPTVEAVEAAGFTKYLPSVKLPLEHFTNDAWAMESWSGRFDPMHPTSLIFKRAGARLTLVGVMYTASRDADTADLDRRVPMSIGTWHRHVNSCTGPPETPRSAYLDAGAKFGLLGSIATKDACDAAGGTFEPIVFGWMIHVWPNETDPANVWAVDPDGSMSRPGTMGHTGVMNDGMQ